MRIKNNETFTIEDEWYLLHGAQISIEDAENTSPLQWKLIKKQIKKVRDVFDKEEGWAKHCAKTNYAAILWKYQNVIKKCKTKSH